ncbi:hypothetical protein GETHLI_03140 [Geothrix limicola]|uniref:Uncharacterized protein n=1 Tax=Geothrix limicola TaxID=2927978 RepID=A0ABQ5QAF9_9BACT|nr:hypothetical protein GETHLI_03140 [Geothrix limicola]
MRLVLNVVPTLLLLAGNLSALAVQPEPPRSVATHRIQVIRPGKGEPRTREAVAARTASPQTPTTDGGMRRTRPYQPAKPGEGAPKG